MKKYSIAFAVFISLFSVSIVAQTASPGFCGHDAATEKLFANDPAARAAAEAKQLELPEQSRVHDRSTSPPTYIIPVVFHIIHDYGSEYISDAQVMDAVAVLNEDFRKLNADSAQIVSPFDTLASDAQIEFRLAQFDPNGNCTNGIDRIASMETYVGDDGSKLNQWPRNMYLNIWVVRFIAQPIAGYTYLPAATDFPSTAAYDGVMILNNFVGRIGTASLISAHTITHQVGHWLGLQHTWGTTSQPGVACGDDGISDTPVTKGWTSCNLTSNNICSSITPENVQNFMEESYCQRMFTPGQVARMHYVLNDSSSERNNIWTTSNLTLTGVLNAPALCLPKADFKANYTRLCAGTYFGLTDLTTGTDDTLCQWTITGPSTLTSTEQNPWPLVLNIPGWYDVTLIATSSAGSDTITKPNYILISSDTATLTPLYSEDFETPNIFYLGYLVNDRYGNNSHFHQVNYVGNSGTGCAALNNFGNTVRGDVDELITPSYFLSYNTGLQISFAYAYATAALPAALNTQTFKLFSSTDCGQTWSARWTGTGSAMVTAGYDQNNFIPAPGDWDTIFLNLPSNLAQSNVRFKFEFTSPEDSAGNNLYIDDINIIATNVGVNEAAGENSFRVYPNPGDGNSTIAYSLSEAADVQYEVFDLSGRLVFSVDAGGQAAGTYTMPVSEETLAPGTYLIRMTIGEQVSAQKFVVTG